MSSVNVRGRNWSRRRLLALGIAVALTLVAAEHPVRSNAATFVGLEVDDGVSTATLHFANAPRLRIDDGQEERRVAQDRVTVPLPFADSDQMQRTEVYVKSATGARIGSIAIEYYPPALYRALGSGDPGYLQVVTDLRRGKAPSWPDHAEWQVAPDPAFSSVDPAPWATFLSEEAELLGAFKAFVDFVEATNVADGRTLCRNDIPSGVMAHGLRVGECFVWCDGLSAMLRDIARSAGHPARRVYLSSAVSALPTGVVVQTSEGHATVEVFDGSRWRWIDPTFRIWEARDRDGNALSLRRVIEELSDPATRHLVEFDLVVAGSRKLRTVSFANASPDIRDNLLRYMTVDKTLTVDPV